MSRQRILRGLRLVADDMLEMYRDATSARDLAKAKYWGHVIRWIGEAVEDDNNLELFYALTSKYMGPVYGLSMNCSEHTSGIRGAHSDCRRIINVSGELAERGQELTTEYLADFLQPHEGIVQQRDGVWDFCIYDPSNHDHTLVSIRLYEFMATTRVVTMNEMTWNESAKVFRRLDELTEELGVRVLGPAKVQVYQTIESWADLVSDGSWSDLG